MQKTNTTESAPFTRVSFTGSHEEIQTQWHDFRGNKIGGSDVAAIMGLSKYKTPLDVWLEKSGLSVSEDISDKPAVYWGNRLEDIIAEEFALRHPEYAVEQTKATYQSVEQPLYIANLDRELTDALGNKGVLEIKTAGVYSASHWLDGVPIYYQTQVQHYLMVTGYTYAWVAVLIAGQDYREYKIERDEEDIAAIQDTLTRFCESIKTNTPPSSYMNPMAAGALTELYKDYSKDFKPMDKQSTEYVRRINAIKAQEKELTQERKELETYLKEQIKDDKGIEDELFRVTWVRSNKQSLDTKKLKAEQPDIVERYTTSKITDGGLRITIKEAN